MFLLLMAVAHISVIICSLIPIFVHLVLYGDNINDNRLIILFMSR
jgi:hypothetical protein